MSLTVVKQKQKFHCNVILELTRFQDEKPGGGAKSAYFRPPCYFLSGFQPNCDAGGNTGQGVVMVMTMVFFEVHYMYTMGRGGSRTSQLGQDGLLRIPLTTHHAVQEIKHTILPYLRQVFANGENTKMFLWDIPVESGKKMRNDHHLTHVLSRPLLKF